MSQGWWRTSRKVPGAAPKGVVGGASGSGLVNGGGVPQHDWGDVLRGAGGIASRWGHPAAGGGTSHSTSGAACSGWCQPGALSLSQSSVPVPEICPCPGGSVPVPQQSLQFSCQPQPQTPPVPLHEQESPSQPLLSPGNAMGMPVLGGCASLWLRKRNIDPNSPHWSSRNRTNSSQPNKCQC